MSENLEQPHAHPFVPSKTLPSSQVLLVNSRMNFYEFCEINEVTKEERQSLKFHLAAIRMWRVLDL
jgi:hypothetical protein